MKKIPVFFPIVIISVLLTFTFRFKCYSKDTPNDTIPEISKVENYIKGGTVFKLEDYIKIYVKNLNRFMRKAPEKDSHIQLYLDSNPISNNQPVSLDSCEGFVLFQIKRDSISSLDIFYKKPRASWDRSLTASIGYSNCCVLKSKSKITLIIIDRIWHAIGVLLIAGFILSILFLAVKSNMIKDQSQLQDKIPYSLGRTQLAFWITIIACSYCFIYISTNEAPILSNSALILLGISASTTTLGKIVNDDQERRDGVDNYVSRGFFTDILSDEKGISIHRTQMVIFTLVTGFIFINKVINLFEIPELNTNLLILMGISSGTYIGLKTKEKSN